jgi:diguanylate cyclase (GGDEF)-like protein
VVSEGVETQKQIDFLKILECNNVQGYYYSQPLPMEAFTKKLDESEVALMPSADDEAMNTQLIVHDYDKDQIMLVIDDLSMNRAIMTDCFKDLFSIIEANNGEAALNYFTRGGRADIIMLDIYMPQVDGFQVLSELKKTSYTKDIPVIITSQADDATIIKALKAGASDFLTKPYTKEDAVRCANRALAAAVRKSRRDEEDMRKRMTVLEKLATTDFLTGLWNNNCFEKKVVEYLGANRNKICNLILIDIDNFKELNDKLGRRMGDELLQKLANKLLFCFREWDVICRISGDEFAVLMKAEMSAEDLAIRMKGFHKNMSTIVQGMPVTCSSGVCRYPDGGRTYSELFENADKSLFQAKRNGKNQCVIYDKTQSS